MDVMGQVGLVGRVGPVDKHICASPTCPPHPAYLAYLRDLPNKDG
jgi:hypothetical protein